MLKLVNKSAYILFQLVTSGKENKGIQVTEGRETKASSKPKKAVFYWFDMDDDAGLISRAASLMRTKLDKEFHRPEIQLDLFGTAELDTALFDTEEETEHPLLTRAFDLAHELPSTVKWKPAIMAGPTPCNLCAQTIEARAIAHTAIVSTPAGHVMHLQCQECKAAEHKPAEPTAPTLRVIPTTPTTNPPNTQTA